MRNYYVYVIELEPRRSGSRKPEVYVGSSALPPSVRFVKHSRSRGSRHVRRHGVRLLPELYEGLNPLSSRREAHRFEHLLRRRLEREGYIVYGSCFKAESEECRL